MALAVLAADSIERAALEKALAAYAAQPKPTQKPGKTHRYAHCWATHDEHCYCVACAPTRLDGRRSQAEEMAGYKGPRLKKIKPTRVADPTFAQKVRLDFCACGHKSASHSEDELGSLLACSACDCTHFQMRHVNGDASGKPPEPKTIDEEPPPPCPACQRGEHCHGNGEDGECICDCRLKLAEAAA